MTESEWMACEDPQAMLTWLQYGLALGSKNPDGTQNILTGPPMPSDRKLGLWVEACRQRWPDLAAKTDLMDRTKLLQAVIQWGMTKTNTPASEIANLLRDIVGNPFRHLRQPHAPECPLFRRDEGIRKSRGCGCRHPWLTPTVLAIAQSAYEERKPDGTLDPVAPTILADALEDAGCDNEYILRHLRGYEVCWGGCFGDANKFPGSFCAFCSGTGWVPMRGPHVRGCWALDLVLGKE